MTDPFVADVHVRERRGARVTTITVLEQGTGDAWPTRATSVPPVVRDKLLRWLGDVPACPHDTTLGMVDTAGAHLEQAIEPGDVEAKTRVGFYP